MAGIYDLSLPCPHPADSKVMVYDIRNVVRWLPGTLPSEMGRTFFADFARLRGILQASSGT